MKKLNRKGFTLIELLAVITIMGILMLVAIPAISRTIENSRRDTFANTALEYIKAVKTEVQSDTLACKKNGAAEANISGLDTGIYYYAFNSAENSGKDLMEQGGKSAWGNSDVKGYVVIKKTVGTDNRTTYEYSISIVDGGHRGMQTAVKESEIKRSKVLTSSQNQQNLTSEQVKYSCSLGN